MKNERIVGGSARLQKLHGELPVADAAGRLDAEGVADRAPHECNRVDGGPARRVEARRRLHEVRSGRRGGPAGGGDLLVRQGRRFDDRLEDRPGDGLADRADVLLHPVEASHLAITFFLYAFIVSLAIIF